MSLMDCITSIKDRESHDNYGYRKYAFWNNKGGTGKTSLAFQSITRYAEKYPKKQVLAIDICPQANLSELMLGGLNNKGSERLLERHGLVPRVAWVDTSNSVCLRRTRRRRSTLMTSSLSQTSTTREFLKTSTWYVEIRCLSCRPTQSTRWQIKIFPAQMHGLR